MKKAIIVLFAVCLLTLTCMIFPASAAGEYIRGDANGDGFVTIGDVTVVQRVIADVEPDETGMIALRGDTDGNDLDINDALNIQRYLAEFENIYNIGERVAVPDSTTPQSTSDPYELPFVPN